MRLNRTILAGTAVAACVVGALAGGVALGRQLGAREAREQIAALIGAASPDDVHIKSIAPGLLGGGAIVEAQVDVAFRMTETKDGWRVADVRLGPGQWENVDMLKRAVDAQKATVAGTELRTLATGVEAYRSERGFLPEAKTEAALVDRLSPRFLPSVIREDPWHRPYEYVADDRGYRLSSKGPDGKANTPDDVVVTGSAKGDAPL